MIIPRMARLGHRRFAPPAPSVRQPAAPPRRRRANLSGRRRSRLAQRPQYLGRVANGHPRLGRDRLRCHRFARCKTDAGLRPQGILSCLRDHRGVSPRESDIWTLTSKYGWRYCSSKGSSIPTRRWDGRARLRAPCRAARRAGRGLAVFARPVRGVGATPAE